MSRARVHSRIPHMRTTVQALSPDKIIFTPVWGSAQQARAFLINNTLSQGGYGCLSHSKVCICFQRTVVLVLCFRFVLFYFVFNLSLSTPTQEVLTSCHTSPTFSELERFLYQMCLVLAGPHPTLYHFGKSLVVFIFKKGVSLYSQTGLRLLVLLLASALQGIGITGTHQP